MYEAGIVEKIESYFDYRRGKRFLKNVMKYIGKRQLTKSTYEFDHNGHKYRLELKEI